MAGSSDWVLLSYKLPREPSNPRVALWRKLRRLGAVQIVDGLVALPADARTREHFDWLADEILEAGGDSGTWIARAGSLRQERLLAARMTEAIVAEYQQIIEMATEAHESDLVAQRRTITRLRREMRRVGARDFFPPEAREQARWAIDVLAELVLETVSTSQ